MTSGPQGEGERLREAAGPHRGDFQGVDPVAVLVAFRGAEGVRGAVEVQAGQLGQAQAVVTGIEYGVRLGADDLDAVAEAGQFAREGPYIDTLAAAERVPFVGEERDTERSLAVGGRALKGPCLTGLSGHSGPPSACTVPRDYDEKVI